MISLLLEHMMTKTDDFVVLHEHIMTKTDDFVVT
jgi:hypothetical protein